MILPFSTKLNGKPTYFVEKIHKSFRIKELNLKAAIDPTIHYTKDYNFVAKDKLAAKIHTIRFDKNDRWKPGTMIDFFINARTKDMFRFAPRIPVVSIQKIEIERHNTTGVWDKDFTVCIDEHYLNRLQIRCLSENDGFETIEAFFEYFSDTFNGKIIHWTDKKY